jgi:hypothetical protein
VNNLDSHNINERIRARHPMLPEKKTQKTMISFPYKTKLGGSGPLLRMAGMSPIFNQFYLHTYAMYIL